MVRSNFKAAALFAGVIGLAQLVAAGPSYSSFALDTQFPTALAGGVTIVPTENGLTFEQCRSRCSSTDSCIGFAGTTFTEQMCVLLGEGGSTVDLEAGFSYIAWQYNYRFGPSCELSVDQLLTANGQCSCTFPRTQDTPFGCSDPIYEEFPLERGKAVRLAASMSESIFIPGVPDQSECQSQCDLQVECVGYEYDSVTGICIGYKLGGTQNRIKTSTLSEVVAWRYGMPQGPQCNRDTNQFVKPGGLCQCDPATQAQATPLGCEEIGSSLRPFAEFTVDQDSATPLAGLIHYFFALNGVTQDTCRGACLGETECIGYTYDPAWRTCRTFGAGGMYDTQAPAGFYLIGYRWNAPGAVSCDPNVDSIPNSNGACFCGANREQNGPWGCLARIDPPGPSQRARRRSMILPGVSAKPYFA